MLRNLFKFGGGEEPKVSFSGEAKDHYLCWSDTLAENATTTTAITVTDARQFAIDMLIKVGTEDNSGAGFKIKAFCIAFAYGSRRQGLFIFWQ